MLEHMFPNTLVALATQGTANAPVDEWLLLSSVGLADRTAKARALGALADVQVFEDFFKREAAFTVMIYRACDGSVKHRCMLNDKEVTELLQNDFLVELVRVVRAIAEFFKIDATDLAVRMQADFESGRVAALNVH